MADPTTTPAQASAKREEKILVINHTEQTYTLPIMDPGKGENPRPSVESKIVLLPGANAVDPDAFEIVSEYPTVQALLRKRTRGGFEVMRRDVRTLAGFKDEEEAKELIDATVDAELLKSWLRAEKRIDLVKAIEAQLEKIDPRRDRADEGEKAGDTE